tara:strand:- start:704 stop:2476 length:1773 start_codon:yes stop_codon:yes gene_type:complete
MEALVIIGLIGAGLLSSKDKDKTETRVNKEIHLPTSDNLYSSEFYEKSNEMIHNISGKNFESSMDDGNRIINTKKLSTEGSKYLEDVVEDLELRKTKENLSDYTYSSISGNFVDKDNFLTNDQGISAQPFFKHAPTSYDYNDTRSMDRLQGDNMYNISKREQHSFFKPEQNVGNVFGNQFGSYVGDKARYNDGRIKDNELPFEKNMVSNIDEKSNLNREIGQLIGDRDGDIDALRSKSDPKLTYQGKILSGKNITQSRGSTGEIFHRSPDKFYENDQDRYFVTNGAYLEGSQRPEQILKDTVRSKQNGQPVGGAAPNYAMGEKRSNYKRSNKMQLVNDSNRNVGSGTFVGDTDYNREGYKAYPNERQVTGERTYESNVSTEVSNNTMGIMDEVKQTVKQTTINSKNNGYIANTSIKNILGIQDDIKKTKKQTTINSKNNGYIHGGHIERSSGYEVPEITTKDSVLTSYVGGAGADVLSDMSKDNYMNAELNPNKEIISKGRAPTLNNTKVVNGVENFNSQTKKLHGDYINDRENGISKVYADDTNVNNYPELTTMKIKNEDRSIAGRIEGNLLDPFKKNPFTQSLSSFAY